MSDPTINTLTMERRFKSAPKTVFAFLTEPEYLSIWWGPENVNLAVKELDFTRPGPWLSVMQNDEGQVFKVSGEVTEVTPPYAIEFTWAWHDGVTDVRGHESRVRFEVQPDANGGSVFHLIHTDLPSDEGVANHEQGWTSSLRKLKSMDA